MEAFDLIKAFDEVLNTTDPPKEAGLKNTTEVPELTSLESILPRLPPEGQAWLKIRPTHWPKRSLNCIKNGSRICRSD